MLDFDFEKATQALNKLAQISGGKINKMKAIKLLWLADRYHLRKYGRPIFNDNYYAMEFGPVGSSTKDLAEFSVLSPEEQEYAARFIKPDAKRLHFESVRNVDLEVFSDSDIEAIDEVFKNYGNKDQFELADFSHYFPEWKKFETVLSSSASRMPMSYSDFFKNPDGETPLKNIFDDSPKELEQSKETFNHNYQVASFWDVNNDT